MVGIDGKRKGLPHTLVHVVDANELLLGAIVATSTSPCANGCHARHTPQLLLESHGQPTGGTGKARNDDEAIFPRALHSALVRDVQPRQCSEEREACSHRKKSQERLNRPP